MTSRMKIGLAAAAGVLALTAGGATLYAQSVGLHGPMAKFDADSNGSVTLAEARAGAAAMFAGADSNKDGRATHEEMMAFHGKSGDLHHGGHKAGHKGDHKAGHKGDHKAGHGAHGGHGGPGGMGPMDLDSDGDGAVTLAEAQKGIEAHFAEIDSNRDGSITAAEMEAMHRAHHGK